MAGVTGRVGSRGRDRLPTRVAANNAGSNERGYVDVDVTMECVS